MNEIRFETVNKVLSDVQRHGNVLLLGCNSSNRDINLLHLLKLRPMYVVSMILERTYGKTNSTV
jgi:hypothetical protein